MMALIRSWLLGMTCAAMVMALVESVVAEGRLRRLCRLAGGLVMILAAVSPVLRVELSDLPDWSASLSAAGEDYTASLEAENDFLCRRIIAEESAAYISDKAAQLGAACAVQVTVEPDQNGTPLPVAAVVQGSLDQNQRALVLELLEGELGVPAEQVRFEETQP